MQRRPRSERGSGRRRHTSGWPGKRRQLRLRRHPAGGAPCVLVTALRNLQLWQLHWDAVPKAPLHFRARLGSSCCSERGDKLPTGVVSALRYSTLQMAISSVFHWRESTHMRRNPQHGGPGCIRCFQSPATLMVEVAARGEATWRRNECRIAWASWRKILCAAGVVAWVIRLRAGVGVQERMEARRAAAAAGAGSPLQPLSQKPRRRSAAGAGGLVVKGNPRV